jgi:hypothetical protein
LTARRVAILVIFVAELFPAIIFITMFKNLLIPIVAVACILLAGSACKSRQQKATSLPTQQLSVRCKRK